MSTLGIIVASTRPTRIGTAIAQWAEAESNLHGGFDEVELIELGELKLPFMDEPNHPQLRDYVHQHSRDWSEKVSSIDAFIFVMPEYNYGYNAPLKNAIDYLFWEWQYKPVGFISYGGVAAGTRAVQMIKQVVTTLKMTPVFEAVPIPFVQQFIDDGVFAPNDVTSTAMKAMSDELVRVTSALSQLRQR